MEQTEILSLDITHIKTASVGISKSTYFEKQMKIHLLNTLNLASSKLIVQRMYFNKRMILSC